MLQVRATLEQCRYLLTLFSLRSRMKKVRNMYPGRERFGEGLETYGRETPISRSGY